VTKEEIISALKLIPLPEEGGFYRETYRSQFRADFSFGHRTAGTCIYYFVTPEDYSALHRVRGDEIFHFYYGDPVEMFQITDEGPRKIILGSNLQQGEIPQVIVPSMVWQGTRLKEGGSVALLGCTVFPGFEFEDFEIANRADLLAHFPDFSSDILRYTR
jgi:uncharacterized protein